MGASEQLPLRPAGRTEQVSAQAQSLAVQPMLLHRNLESRAEQIGPRPRTPHPGEEIGIIVAAVTQRVDDRHDLARAVGKMRVEPGTEQGRDFEWQANRQIVDRPRAAFGRAFDDMLDLMIGDRRDDRRDRDDRGDAGIGQPPYRGQPALGMRGATNAEKSRRRGLAAGPNAAPTPTSTASTGTTHI